MWPTVTCLGAELVGAASRDLHFLGSAWLAESSDLAEYQAWLFWVLGTPTLTFYPAWGSAQCHLPLPLGSFTAASLSPEEGPGLLHPPLPVCRVPLLLPNPQGLYFQPRFPSFPTTYQCPNINLDFLVYKHFLSVHPFILLPIFYPSTYSPNKPTIHSFIYQFI